VAAGTYSLTVEATDNRGATITSSSAAISVTNSPASAVSLLNPRLNGSVFSFSFLTEGGRSYTVQFTPAINPTNWQTLTNLTGNGSTAVISDANATATQRFYRVGAQ
jgi:hypothetical protein